MWAKKANLSHIQKESGEIVSLDALLIGESFDVGRVIAIGTIEEANGNDDKKDDNNKEK